VGAETPSPARLALVGVGEIHQGLLAKISIQRVRDMTLRSDFPRPAAELAEGDVWFLEEVQTWLADHSAAVAGLLGIPQGPVTDEAQ
jgi:prophage regulatory protein